MHVNKRRPTAGVVVLALLLLASAACAADEAEPVAGRAPAPVDRSEGRQADPTREPVDEEKADSSAGGTVAYEVWFARDDRLAVAWRSQPATPRVGTAALEQLFRGPGSSESGLASAIPPDTQLRGLTIEDGTARVDLNGEYESGGGSRSMSMRLAQVVFTLTQFPTVHDVVFLLDGVPVETFSGEGLVLDHPLARSDFEDLAPPIIVERPRPGGRTSSPVVIEGTANVFEATVSIRILDEDGNELADTFTTASCGTGCRGAYEKKVSFSIDEAQPGTIEVFEQSAEDGSPLHGVRVPVTLAP